MIVPRREGEEVFEPKKKKGRRGNIMQKIE